MRKNRFFSLLLSATMLAAAATSLTACHDDDATDPNPLAKQVSGLWWALSDQEGTYGTGEYAVNYTRIGQAVNFNEDGTGYGITFLFDDESGDPLVIIGGQKLATFTYTSTSDGRISPNFDSASERYADYFKQWSMSYTGGIVTTSDGTTTLQMEHPSKAMAVLIEDWDKGDRDGGGNAAIGGTGFNPNDADFTRTNWRNEEGIYLYDGTGEYTISQGGRSCKFSLVPLPWYNGPKYTNLPDGFCDNITPENGWELVLNLCGNTTGSLKNNNFFALYNKYLGILRFFYYLPEGYSTGNDHVWEISMSDHLAQQNLFGYGVPSDRTINKAALGQQGDGSYMEYVAPWVKNMSNDGLVVPNVGWWAFDVDLSMYRDGKVNLNDIISLQMRSWNKTHTTLYSAMTANIDGTLKASLKLDQVKAMSSSSSKGVLMGLQAAAQAGSALVNFYSGNWAQGLTSVGQMLGTSASLAGLGGGSGSTSYSGGSLDGTISLGLDGSINTDGVISGSAPTVGIASPTITLNDFDLKNSHIGEGVWNIKTAPVVYWATNIFAIWDTWQRESSTSYFCFCPYFFDPSSIEIELNPNVFPDSEIEWVEVDAICGARSERQPIFDEHNKALRSAYGVGGQTSIQYLEAMYRSINLGQDDCLWDFLYNSSDKYGLNALNTIYTSEQRVIKLSYGPMYTWNDKIQGRGIGGYAIEPQVRGSVSIDNWHDLIIYRPFLEVNVKVLVKMKGMQQPIVLSRNYLPEIKGWDYGVSFNNSVKKTRPYASKMKGHTDLYDYQIKRINDIIARYSIPANISTAYPGYNYIPITGTSGWGISNYDKLFDGKNDTQWYSRMYHKEDGVWFVEFMSRNPIDVKEYYLTTSSYASYDTSENPKKWKLYGKLNYGDQWTLLDSQENGGLPGEKFKETCFSCSHMKCQYFRFEISEVPGNGEMSLSEFRFNQK